MSSLEFTESLAFEQLEPDPLQTVTRQLAHLTSLMHNVYRDHRYTQPYTPNDFLPSPPIGEAEVASTQRWSDVLADMRSNYAARPQ